MKKFDGRLLASIIFIIIVGYGAFRVRHDLEKIIWQLKSALLEEKFKVSNLEEIQLYTLNTEGAVLPDTIVKYIPEGVCILRLHDGICLSCYAENLSRLESHIDGSDGIRLFVLGSYNFTTQLKEELMGVDLNQVKFVNLPSCKVLPADSIGCPYLFTINKEGVIMNLHFFQKENFSLTSRYFQAIKRLGSDKKYCK